MSRRVCLFALAWVASLALGSCQATKKALGLNKLTLRVPAAPAYVVSLHLIVAEDDSFHDDAEDPADLVLLDAQDNYYVYRQFNPQGSGWTERVGEGDEAAVVIEHKEEGEFPLTVEIESGRGMGGAAVVVEYEGGEWKSFAVRGDEIDTHRTVTVEFTRDRLVKRAN